MRNIEQLVEASPDPDPAGHGEVPPRQLLAWRGGEVETGTAMVEEARDLFAEAGRAEPGAARPQRARLPRRDTAATPTRTRRSRATVLAEAEAAGDRFAELQALCSLVFALQWPGPGRASPTRSWSARSRSPASAAKWYRTSYLLGQQAFAAAVLGRGAEADERFAAGRAANPSYRDTLLPDHEIMVAWLRRRPRRRPRDGGRDLLDWSQGAASPRRMGVASPRRRRPRSGRVDERRRGSTTMDAVFGGRPFWFHGRPRRRGRAGCELALRGDADAARRRADGVARVARRRVGPACSHASPRSTSPSSRPRRATPTPPASPRRPCERSGRPTREPLQAIDTVAGAASLVARRPGRGRRARRGPKPPSRPRAGAVRGPRRRAPGPGAGPDRPVRQRSRRSVEAAVAASPSSARRPRAGSAATSLDGLGTDRPPSPDRRDRARCAHEA